MAAALLAIEHLRVEFPEVLAVDDLSLNLQAGDVCGLIGPNGAGKTTTLRAVSGLLERTCGSVEIEGHEFAREPDELKRRLGFMPDASAVYDHLTVTEFLDHFARAYAVPNRVQRIKDCLESTWLADQPDALCGALSRGMKQRLVLAKTLLPDPQVLLLDEPASGLDPLGRIELWKLVSQLHDAGKVVLISSPILAELSNFCNKAAIMEHGKLLAFGAIAELGKMANPQRISVRWCAHSEKAMALLAASPGVKNILQAESGATFAFELGEDALHELLRLLILQEVHVTEWRGLQDNLEQMLLRSGAEAVK